MTTAPQSPHGMEPAYLGAPWPPRAHHREDRTSVQRGQDAPATQPAMWDRHGVTGQPVNLGHDVCPT
eukprot:12910854-Prorocentrum_lima.AAC.1